MAKSGKGQSGDTAGPKSAAKDASKELGRLEKRLQKARDVEAKRKKQASAARGEVVQLTAQIKELRAPTVERPKPRALSTAPSVARAKPAAAKPAAAKPAAAKPKVTVSSSGTTATARRSTTSTSTRRKTATSAATRVPRTPKTASADGSGDGTGPT